MVRSLRALITGRLWRDESGQDLLEYAILAVTIGIAGALVFPTIIGKLSNNYGSSNAAIQADWQPCDPGGCTP